MNLFAEMKSQVICNSLVFLVIEGKKFQCCCTQELRVMDSIQSVMSQGVLCPKIY